MEKNFIDHCKTRFFRLFCFVTIFTMFVTATACGNKDEPGKGVSEEFKCSAETLYFPVEGDNIILTVISPVKPEVTISESWVAVGSFETTGTLNNTYKIIRPPTIPSNFFSVFFHATVLFFMRIYDCLFIL